MNGLQQGNTSYREPSAKTIATILIHILSHWNSWTTSILPWIGGIVSTEYSRMPELLEELMIAKEHKELKKVTKAYEKVDLLFLDQWLIRCLVLVSYFNL